jgi:proline dehydrogenase
MHVLNKAVVAAIPLVPRRLIRFFAARYIAGESLDDAIRSVRQLNSEGVCGTMDVLGEDVTTRAEAIAAKDESIGVLHAIAREKLDSNLSIKLTSLGLKIDNQFCIENVRNILSVAVQYKNFVRIDMEDSSCTADTIDVFRTVHREFANVGIVVQAYLFRTQEDIRELLKGKAGFRLCKGIYKEPATIAFQKREDVQRNYMALLEQMLAGGSYVGIATHDSVLVDGAVALITRLGLRRDQYEFQMLLGVRPELRRRLVRDGHKVRLYVPFGEHWYGYSTRRFKENPEIAGYVFKALFTRNA